VIKSGAKRILDLSRTKKRAIALLCDMALCILTVATAYFLRVERWIVPNGVQWLSYLFALAFALPIFIRFGLYRAIFRYVGSEAMMSVGLACGLYGLCYATLFSFIGIQGIPRTTGFIQPVLMLIAIGGSRVIARYWLGGDYLQIARFGQPRRVLIYGAGSAGRQLAAALKNSEEMQLVGFVDDDETLQNSVLNGTTIHPPANLRSLIHKLKIEDLLLAIPSASRHRRLEILEEMRGSPAILRTLPGLMDLAQGRVTVNDLRELDIEDLLGRDVVPPNQLLLGRNIAEKIVLVTGAGGSIGSELCRQVLQLRPTMLVLVELSEFNLYAIHQELEQRLARDGDSETKLIPILGSVRDQARMEAILTQWKPDTIYHAAAYKHVPLVESNPAEGVRNNIFGTQTMAELAQKHGIRDFVLISTDKAVRPTNIMGATKRLAEQVLQALAAKAVDGGTRFSIVRFGNVLGSSGSVVPLFRKQIKAGGPVTITHHEITRYFMTIPEAAQLVIQAAAMANGGEVFVLDMGDPVKIIDLAKRMIELSGLSLKNADNPHGDIEISVVGLRPGEKLYEELLIGDNPMHTAHSRIMKASETFMPLPTLKREFLALDKIVQNNDLTAIKAEISRLVPEYIPAIDDLALLERRAIAR
jgi:FlaA1/EpsC-like NDP-sugar epimerase